LAELEEYFSTLITYMAQQRGDQYAAISSVPLETLTNKDFNKKELQIDAPLAAEEKTEAESAIEDSDVVIDPKVLYQRFYNMLDKNQIDI
jgi:hypothetical protein